MLSSNLTISFGSTTNEDGKAYGCPDIITQEEWDNKGKVTRLDIINELVKTLYTSALSTTLDCGKTPNNSVATQIHIYPGDQNIGAMGVSNGTVGPGTMEEVDIEDSVTFSGEATGQLEHTPTSVQSKEWDGKVFGLEGDIIPYNPQITVDGIEVRTTLPVYGTAIIKYKALRITRDVTIPPELFQDETRYESYAWVVKDCGVETFQINPPSSSGLSNCANSGMGGSTSVTGEDEDKEVEKPKPKNDSYDIDYCTQLKIGDE